MRNNVSDRMKEALFALVRAAMPYVDYYALYRARVVAQSANLSTVDVVPDEDRLPTMSQVPIKLGIPGATVKFDLEQARRENRPVIVLVGWEGGDPARSFVAGLLDPSTATVSVSITATKIELGGKDLTPLLEGVVTGQTPCAFTGAPHHTLGGTSTIVLAKKGNRTVGPAVVKACAFCKASPARCMPCLSPDGDWAITCDSCGARTPRRKSHDEVLEIWSRMGAYGNEEPLLEKKEPSP